MRKILLCLTVVLVAIMLLAGCAERRQQAAAQGVCRIHGTAPQQYNDKRIFLVPLYGPKTAEYVDSVEIKNGHFEFETDTLMMAKILVDYHYRLGVQPLLVVTEPGDVSVVIDSISHASGTPQNDSLEKWKDATLQYNAQQFQLRRTGQKQQADSLHLSYKYYTRRLARNMGDGMLHDFLLSLYPQTYKRQTPDGRTVTINADTNEEIPK